MDDFLTNVNLDVHKIYNQVPSGQKTKTKTHIKQNKQNKQKQT